MENVSSIAQALWSAEVLKYSKNSSKSKRFALLMRPKIKNTHTFCVPIQMHVLHCGMG